MHTETYTPMFSIIHNNQKVEIAQQLMNKFKMWHIHRMEYYSVIKRNDALTHATVWINLEHIMLSERSQTQKATY